MIGVISHPREQAAVAEFFELFKTPWEHFRQGGRYGVVISSGGADHEVDAGLWIVYGSRKTIIDEKCGTGITLCRRGSTIEREDHSLPVYGELAAFGARGRSILRTGGNRETCAIETNSGGRTIIRIGYDLFREIETVLTNGQPASYAQVPTIDLHIEILRSLIVKRGIPLVEIPPVPASFDFTACLTHDVDFYGIRRHLFDHTMLGFVYRALIATPVDCLKGRARWNKVLKNWTAVLSLPFIYAGMKDDFMVEFDRFLEIERGLPATWFFVPFASEAGLNGGAAAPSRRAVKYTLDQVAPEIKKLSAAGCEIGVHGIDAWRDGKKGALERERISEASGKGGEGVRMHWLYCDESTPRNLEEAGYLYDATVGYNEAIGYRAGTSQVYRPLSAGRLLELPMNVMDSALFYPDRMNLTERQAAEAVNALIHGSIQRGGTLTINWHHRSLGPERYWDEFYINLVKDLKARNAWFATALDAVRWFKMRRSVQFGPFRETEGGLQLSLESDDNPDLPELLCRVYNADETKTARTGITETDVPFRGRLETVIPRDAIRREALPPLSSEA